LRPESGIAEDPSGNIESLLKLYVRFGGPGLCNDCILLSDSRSLGSKISAALFFEAGRGWIVSRASFSRSITDWRGRVVCRARWQFHLGCGWDHRPRWGFGRRRGFGRQRWHAADEANCIQPFTRPPVDADGYERSGAELR
jgi:hypothetical protein